MSNQRPKWHQFSFKSLFLLLTLVAVFIAVYQIRIGRYQATVRKLQQAGASLQFTGTQQTGLLPERVQGVTVPTDADAAKIIRIARDLPDLPLLALSGSNVQDEDFQLLRDFPALTTLHLTETAITERGLRILHDVKTLNTVYVGQTHLDPSAIEALEAATACRVVGQFARGLTAQRRDALRRIIRGGGQVTYRSPGGQVQSVYWKTLDEEKLALIAQFSTITSLDLKTTTPVAGVTDAWLEPIGRMRGLERLQLRGPQVSDQGLSHLAELTRLQDLTIEADAATGERVNRWKAMPSLGSLALVSATLEDLNFLNWKAMGNLRHLQLECPRLTGTAISAVTLPPSLEDVVFSRMSLDGASLSWVENAGVMTRLVLRDSELTDQAWTEVGKLRAQTGLLPPSLSLQGTHPPSDAQLAADLAAWQSVQIINVALTDKHLTALAAMPSLSSLSIWRSDLSTADVRILGKCRKLGELHLLRCKLTGEAISTLKEYLPNCDISVSE